MAIIADGKLYRLMRDDAGQWEIHRIGKVRPGVVHTFTAEEADLIRIAEVFDPRIDDKGLVDERCRELLAPYYNYDEKEL
jgi:hypothetical protein